MTHLRHRAAGNLAVQQSCVCYSCRSEAREVLGGESAHVHHAARRRGGSALAVCRVWGTGLRVGFLWDGPDVFPDAIEAFRQGLRELGYVEGRNLAFEYRWGEGKPDRIRALAQELVRLKVGGAATAWPP